MCLRSFFTSSFAIFLGSFRIRPWGQYSLDTNFTTNTPPTLEHEMEGLFWQPLPSVGTTTTPLSLEHEMGGLFYVYYYYYYIYILYLIILKNILYKYIIICSGLDQPCWPQAKLTPGQGQLRVARPLRARVRAGKTGLALARPSPWTV